MAPSSGSIGTGNDPPICYNKEITEQLQSLYNDGELLSQSIVSELVAEAFAENLTLRTFVEGDPIDFLVDEVLGNIQLSL